MRALRDPGEAARYAAEVFWIDLTVLRTYTVHTDNEELADYGYSRLGEAARRFRDILAAAV